MVECVRVSHVSIIPHPHPTMYHYFVFGQSPEKTVTLVLLEWQGRARSQESCSRCRAGDDTRRRGVIFEILLSVSRSCILELALEMFPARLLSPPVLFVLLSSSARS